MWIKAGTLATYSSPRINITNDENRRKCVKTPFICLGKSEGIVPIGAPTRARHSECFLTCRSLELVGAPNSPLVSSTLGGGDQDEREALGGVVGGSIDRGQIPKSESSLGLLCPPRSWKKISRSAK